MVILYDTFNIMYMTNLIINYFYSLLLLIIA